MYPFQNTFFFCCKNLVFPLSSFETLINNSSQTPLRSLDFTVLQKDNLLSSLMVQNSRQLFLNSPSLQIQNWSNSMNFNVDPVFEEFVKNLFQNNLVKEYLGLNLEKWKVILCLSKI